MKNNHRLLYYELENLIKIGRKFVFDHNGAQYCVAGIGDMAGVYHVENVRKVSKETYKDKQIIYSCLENCDKCITSTLYNDSGECKICNVYQDYNSRSSISICATNDYFSNILKGKSRGGDNFIDICCGCMSLFRSDLRGIRIKNDIISLSFLGETSQAIFIPTYFSLSMWFLTNTDLKNLTLTNVPMVRSRYAIQSMFPKLSAEIECAYYKAKMTPLIIRIWRLPLIADIKRYILAYAYRLYIEN